MPELHFKGKEFVYNHHLSVPYRPLVIDNNKSVGATHDLNNNLIVHGDNLHALKALMPLYAGKVDCVFIDPPYNTGNEGWCYNDNVNSPMLKEWLATNPVGLEDGLRHDKWLAMMYPRLKLLYELLSETGSFWITLDDNEIHRARAMLDEIFGEEAFAACIVWQKKYAVANDQQGIAPMHDYLLVYQKTEWQRNLLERTEENDSQYRHEDAMGVFRADNYTCNKTAEERPNLYYPITNPNTGEEVLPNKSAVWRYSRERHAHNEKNGFVYWGKDGKSKVPAYKRYRHLLKNGGDTVPGTWWTHGFAGHTDEARKEFRDIFPNLVGSEATITPKPVRLLERIMDIATSENSIVLDSFAGSGTTAHAVMNANNKDGGTRRFILVECESYADSLTAERMRRVINGYNYKGTLREELHREKLTFTSLKKANKLLEHIASIENLESHNFDAIKKEVKDGELIVTGEKNITAKVEGLGGTFTYCTLGEPIDLDGILTGQNLPSYEAIGSWLFHTATGDALDASRIDKANWYLGETSAFYVWLVYKPELEFLKSRDSALTLNLVENITKAKQGKKHLVFAPAKFVPNKTLLPLGVEYAPLPFSLYKLEK
jgi:adenine-specific DNA-methyltransferase